MSEQNDTPNNLIPISSAPTAKMNANAGGPRKKTGESIDYTWGKEVVEVKTIYEKDGSGAEYERQVHTLLARNISPVALVEDIEMQELSVRYDYETGSGELRTGHFDVVCTGDSRLQRVEVSQMARTGVMVEDLEHPLLAKAFLAWKSANDTPQLRKNLLSSPGWHRHTGKDLYVASKSIVIGGDASWFCKGDSQDIMVRSKRAGSSGEWLENVAAEVVTPGLISALGVSLCGPIFHMLGRQGFGLHFYGRSSSGKSTALQVAGSVWGDPDMISHDSVVRTWDATPNALKNNAVTMNSACVLLDELGVYTGYPGTIGEIIYSLMGGQMRARANNDGSAQEKSGWRLSGLSTGEISIKDKMGAAYKGGISVRMADVQLKLGDMTTDALHARRINQKFLKCYGDVGESWVKFLASDAGFAAVQANIDKARAFLECKRDVEQPEVGRILDNFEILGGVLYTFAELTAKIFGDSGTKWIGEKDVEDTLLWLIDAIQDSRGAEQDPYDRAFENFMKVVLTQPANFPNINEMNSNGSSAVYGFRRNVVNVDGPQEPLGFEFNSNINDAQVVCVSQRMLSKAGILSDYSAKNFLTESIEKGKARDLGRVRIKSIQANWYEFDIEA